jgi:SAM-dependent methyltransferase
VAILEPHAHLTLVGANEFECLRTFPADIGWRVWRGEHPSEAPDGAPATFAIEAIDAALGRHTLFSQTLDPGTAQAVSLEWPASLMAGPGFDLTLRAGPFPVVVDIEASYESRTRILRVVKGAGVEVGPGLNPHILPSENVSVRYVESAGADEWMRNYKKTDAPSIAEQQDLWSRYMVGDAQTLSTVADGSLDFIYSSHVFEHLMNPLGVLENWRRKLTPTGIVLGVVPDCRYIFDLRQPPSTTKDWLRQHAEGEWSIGRAQYEKWCQFTAPYNTPEDLVARNYSIHVHYYTPKSFAQLCALSIERGLFEGVQLETGQTTRILALFSEPGDSRCRRPRLPCD